MNGLGDCELCNYTKEAPGWSVSTEIDENGCHTAEFTTPTGARHRSTAPRLPGLRTMLFSDQEVSVAMAIAEFAA